jgi:hypothetical protein
MVEPAKYDYVISWYNGSIQYIISQDVQGSSNSLTLDYLVMDEAKFLNFEKLKDETFPANGGTTRYFSDCPWHHGVLIVSDMPTSKRGSWFLSYREQMSTELIDTIQGIVYEVWRLRQMPKTSYTGKMLQYYNTMLSDLRANAVYYREWSTLENVEILGEKYIRQMKRDLPPLVFQTSILSKRISRMRDGFYPALIENKHTYTAYNNDYLQSLDYDFERMKNPTCVQDRDVDLDSPICGAFDYNANINWLVVGQPSGMKIKFLKSFYVKYERKLRELVNDFCEYYRSHRTREFVYYYDNTALGSNYAVSDEDFAAVICDQLDKNGWTVIRKHTGNPLKHKEKYLIIDQALKGQDYLFPMINKPNNEALWLALTHTGVVINSRGFSKDKSGEKLAETEEDRLEHRTDGTDAFDTLLIGLILYPYEGSRFRIGSSF